MTTQRAPALRPIKSPSALAKPDNNESLSFQWERFSFISRELPPLFRRHWNEIALNKEAVPLDPDWNKYYDLDLLGLLAVLTARTRKGTLVGYYFVVLGPHLHYVSTKWGHTDMFWLDPAHRRGWTGIRMIRAMIDGMKKAEVKVLAVNLKLHFEQDRGTIERIFRRFGFAPSDLVMVKVLE